MFRHPASHLKPALVVIVFAGAVSVGSSSSAQRKVFFVPGEGAAVANESFTLVRTPPETTESLEEFHRAALAGDWEKAFRLSNKLLAESPDVLIPDKDGFSVSMRMIIARHLAKLPTAGKQAYRVFNNSAAKALWDQSQREEGAAEFSKLSRLATVDLVTSVGDLAANRLGDILFEQGDLDAAAAAWQSILTERPDSPLRRVDLLVKISTAMARAGRSEELALLARQIARQHAGEQVLAGGKRIPAADYAAELSTAQPAESQLRPFDSLPDFALPDRESPLWQLKFFDGPLQTNTNLSYLVVNGRAVQTLVGPPERFVPTAIAGGSLYGSLHGCDFAVDLATGKLLWSSGSFTDAARIVQSTVTERSSLAVAGNELWTLTPVATPVITEKNHPYGSGLVASGLLVRRDMKTGGELFNSCHAPALANWNFFGKPAIGDGKVCILARKKNQPTDLYVVAISSSDGRLAWSTQLGTSRLIANYAYLKPTLVMHGAQLHVDTGVGTILELDAASGGLNWAYSRPFGTSGWPASPYPTALYAAAGQPANPCGLLASDGMLYFKGRGSHELCAIQLRGPGVAWTLSVKEDLQPVAVDSQRIYLASSDLVEAYHVKTQQLAWQSRFVGNAQWIQPLVTRSRYYQFTSQAICELDKVGGKLVNEFAGSDEDASGGALLVTPTLLITVSSQAIRAYPLGRRAETVAASKQPRHESIE